MTLRDLKNVLVIERECFKEPFSPEILKQELKIKVANVWVAAHLKKAVGYIDFWMIVDQMELVSVAVHPKFQGRGIAQGMMKKMIRYGRRHGVRFVVLDVRTSNRVAQHLYRKFGFRQVGLRKQYYSDNREDALIMKKDLP